MGIKSTRSVSRSWARAALAGAVRDGSDKVLETLLDALADCDMPGSPASRFDNFWVFPDDHPDLKANS